MKARPVSTNQLEPAFDPEGRQTRSGLDSQGREINDPEPLSPPVGYEAPSTLEQIVTQLVRRRDFVEALEKQGVETFEEADDFEVDDEDYDPRFPETIYEAYFEAKSKRRDAVASRLAEASRIASAGSASGSSAASSAEKPSGSVASAGGTQGSKTAPDDPGPGTTL